MMKHLFLGGLIAAFKRRKSLMPAKLSDNIVVVIKPKQT